MPSKKYKLKIVDSYSKNPQTLKLKSKSKFKNYLSKSKKLIKKSIKNIDSNTNQTNMLASKPNTKPKFKIIKPEQDEPHSFNNEFIALLEELSVLQFNQGDVMRGRAYAKAAEAILKYDQRITNPDQLIKLPGIGKTIVTKLKEYIETGKIKALETARANPVNIFTGIYGVGPKKAKDLVSEGIISIEELKEKQNIYLNDTQKVGLKYYDDILLRIPREEIDQFEKTFEHQFEKIKNKYDGAAFQIVGSYRRGAKNSGDIDVIVTSNNDVKILKDFLQQLESENIITYKLTDGKIKVLVIGRLDDKHPFRRIDFLYSPPKEYAFAVLYFTGSKAFNTMMRQRALDLGYTLNEHGFHHMVNGKKGKELETPSLFKSEKDIFDFLNMEFKNPEERKDGNAVVLKSNLPISENIEIKSDLESEQSQEEMNQESKPTKIIIKKKKNKKLTLKKPPVTSSMEKIEDFKKNGISSLKQLSKSEISEMIRFANDKYYNSGKSILSDNQYDIVKEYLEQIDPSNDVFDEIGAPIQCEGICRNKVKLPYEMGSMDKIKPDTKALEKWLAKYNVPKEYLFSAKLDGVSGMYANGKLYTRGNGKEGQDVSHLIPYLNLPKQNDIVVRGEFLISKENFENHFQGKANPRNTVSGIINKLSVDKKEVKYLDFIAYELIVPELPPVEQMKLLEKQNLDVVRYLENDSPTNELLSNTLMKWRENYKYEIDGIICTHNKIYPRKSGNPEHSFAFKMVLSDQIAEAKVVDVLWTPSKDGFLKPRIRIEPIHLGGVKIEYATAFNGAFVETNKLGIGSVVKLIRSGDVIPYIMEVTEPASTAKMPSEEYEWNNTHVDIILKDMKNNEVVLLKNITSFFKELNVAGLSSGNIKKLIKTKYDSVPKILAMSENDFLKIDGFKEKLANKIHTNIENAINQANLITLMSASNIFGRGLGEKKIKPILHEYPDILISDENDESKIKKISEIKGMGLLTAKAFVSHIPEFLDFIKTANLNQKLEKMLVQESVVDTSNPLYQKKIVLTGFRDALIEEFIKKSGGELTTSVSKNTYLVLVKSKEEDSGKADKGRELGILMTKDEFIKSFNI